MKSFFFLEIQSWEKGGKRQISRFWILDWPLTDNDNRESLLRAVTVHSKQTMDNEEKRINDLSPLNVLLKDTTKSQCFCVEIHSPKCTLGPFFIVRGHSNNIQAALAIRGLGIHGFDYSRT